MIDIDRLQLKNEFNDQHDWVSILKLAPMVSTSTFLPGSTSRQCEIVWTCATDALGSIMTMELLDLADIERIYIYIYISCAVHVITWHLYLVTKLLRTCVALCLWLWDPHPASASGTDYWANVCRCSTLEQMIAIVVSKSLWFLKRIANPSKPAALGVANCDFMLVM